MRYRTIFSAALVVLLQAPFPIAVWAQAIPDSVSVRHVPRALALLGITGMSGRVWQPYGVEAGVSRSDGSRPEHSSTAMVRMGTFVENVPGSRRIQGYFASLVIGRRAPFGTLAALGSTERRSYLRAVAAVEAGGEISIRSPLLTPPTSTFVAALLGLRFGPSADGQSVSLMVGPSLRLGHERGVRMQVSLRNEMQLGW